MSTSSQYITLAPTNASIKPLRDESFCEVNNSTSIENGRIIHDSQTRMRNSISRKHNPCPSLKTLNSLAAQSCSSRSVLSRLPACRTFSKILSVKKEEPKHQFQLQRPLVKVENPHAHDVLCGRGNHVNCHPGNEYYRALVKRFYPEYISTPKPDKPRIALNIHRAVRMRDPPGHFLKQDRESKIWEEIDDQKAMNKTRQALREGVNVKNAAMEDAYEPNYHETESQATSSDARQLTLPLHGASTDTTPMTHDVVVADRAQSTDKQIPQVVFAETDQSQAISIASRLINLKGGSNGIQPNIVPSNIMVTNDAPSENQNEKYNTALTCAAGVMDGRTDYPMADAINAKTNAVDTIAETNDLINGISSRIVRNNGSLPIDSLLNSIISRTPALTKKRIARYDTTEEDSKRLKTYSSGQNFSPIKDSVGAAALLAMSSSGNNERNRDVNFVNKSSVANNRVGNTASQLSPTRIWKANSCRGHISCDACLGTGTLPIPSAMISQYDQNIEPSIGQDLFTANRKETFSSEDESRKLSPSPSTIQLFNVQQANSYGGLKPNTSLEIHSAWIEKIREAEKKWGILPDENIKYPERIKVIERKSNEYRKLLQRANNASSSSLENEAIFSLTDAEDAQRNLEEAERKYGITPLEGRSCAERVKVVERAASLYKLEQEERNWGLVSLQHHTCEERAELVNQTAIAYMKRLGPLY